MELYFNPNRPDHVANIEMFRRLQRRFEWMEFFKPNPEKAPWHIQVKIDCATGEPIWLNFWPHTGKAQRDGCPSVAGEESIRLMISEAIEDSAEDLSVLEDFQERQAAEM